MSKQHINRLAQRRSQIGMSLIEVTIALGILLVASAGIMALFGYSMVATENQGHLLARVSEYSQDKMEQLFGLAYTDTLSDTSQFPTAPTGGTGLAIGGSSNPATPATGYVDYLDYNGNVLPIVGGVAPSSWYYIRVWQISNPAGAPVSGGITTLKQITTTTKVRRGVGGTGGGAGAAPQATMSTLMTYPKP